MAEINGLPVYEVQLGDFDEGVYATSIVSKPAIESNFLKFGEDKPQFKFVTTEDIVRRAAGGEVVDNRIDTAEELREIVGAIMIPNLPIYRNVNGMEFYVTFPPQIIRQLVTRMLSEGMVKYFTIEHTFDANYGDVQPMELWIKDSETDKSVELGFDEPIGTAFMRAKINSEPLWNFIKENDLNGFSIELDASIVETFSAANEDETKGEQKDLQNMEENKIETPEKEDIQEVSLMEKMFNSHLEVNGTKLYFNDELKEEATVFVEKDDVPVAYDGEFVDGDNKYIVKGGVVREVENIQLSTDEKIGAIQGKIDNLVETLNTLFEKQAEIEAKEEDLALREKQLDEKFKQAEENPKQPIRQGFEAIKQNRLEFAKSEWIKKFSKNNK